MQRFIRGEHVRGDAAQTGGQTTEKHAGFTCKSGQGPLCIENILKFTASILKNCL